MSWGKRIFRSAADAISSIQSPRAHRPAYPPVDSRIISDLAAPSEWRVPTAMDAVINRVVNEKRVYAPDAAQRSDRERWRAEVLDDSLELCTIRQIDSYATTTLLDDISRGARNFALYLSQVPHTRDITEFGSLMYAATFADYSRRVDLAELHKGIPILWLANPLYDPRPYESLLRAQNRSDRSHRLELDEAWRPHIAALVGSAKLILIDGNDSPDSMSPELQLVAQCGRLDAAFHMSDQSIMVSDVTPYSPEAFARAWKSRRAPRRPTSFAPATYPWVRGSKRAELSARLRAEMGTVDTHSTMPQQLSAARLDEALFAYAKALHFALALEDLETLTGLAQSLRDFISGADEDLLPHKHDLGRAYHWIGEKSSIFRRLVNRSHESTATSDKAAGIATPAPVAGGGAVGATPNSLRALFIRVELFKQFGDWIDAQFVPRVHELLEIDTAIGDADRKELSDQLELLLALERLSPDARFSASGEVGKKLKAVIAKVHGEDVDGDLRRIPTALRPRAYEYMREIAPNHGSWRVLIAFNEAITAWGDLDAVPMLVDFVVESPNASTNTFTQHNVKTGTALIGRSRFCALISERVGYDYEQKLDDWEREDRSWAAERATDEDAEETLPAWAIAAQAAVDEHSSFQAVFESKEWRCTFRRGQSVNLPIPQIDIDSPFRQLLVQSHAARQRGGSSGITAALAEACEETLIRLYFPHTSELDLEDWTVVLDPHGEALEGTLHTVDVERSRKGLDRESHFHYATYGFAEWDYYDHGPFAPAELMVRRLTEDGTEEAIWYELPVDAR